MNNKKLRQILAASLAIGAFTFAPNFYNSPFTQIAQAEVRTYQGVGEDYPNQYENPEISKLRAVNNAVNAAVAKAGVALTAYSTSKNFNLIQNDIQVIVSTKYKIVGEPECKKTAKQVTDLSSMIIWKATANVNVDDIELQNWLKRDEKDRSTISQLELETRKADVENNSKIQDLRKRAQTLTTEEEINTIKAEFEQADKEFLANQKIKEGNTFYFDKNYKDAIKSYSEAIKIDSNSFWAYMNRGNMYSDMQEYKKAISDYNKAIQIRPDNSYAYDNRGIIYAHLKNYKDAVANFSKAIELNPEDFNAYNNRGVIYRNFLANPENAVADYSKALEINPDNIESYFNRGEAYLDLKEYESAINDFDKIIADFSESLPAELLSEVYYGRKLCYDGLGEIEKAKEDFEKAVSLNPNVEKEWNNLKTVDKEPESE